MIHRIHVVMTYATTVEIEAETRAEAEQEARDRAGDGKLLRDADITDVETYEA